MDAYSELSSPAHPWEPDSLGNPGSTLTEIEVDRLLDSVEITTHTLEGRTRQVQASITVPVAAEILWRVLTDYEGLANFIPNLSSSRLLPHPNGGIRLEQVGGQRILKINFSARVVLDMTEEYPHRINFTIVEGDFKKFAGYWQLTPQEQGTELTYFLEVRPKLTMPVKVLECRLNIDLPRNLVAIYQQAIKVQEML